MTTRETAAGGCRNLLLLRVGSTVAALSCMIAAGGFSQSPAMVPPIPARMAFDVASVKQNKSGDKPYSNFPLGPGAMYTPNGGTFTATGYPVWFYIMFAYKMTDHELGSIRRQLPSWASDERYDILAKTDKHDASKDDMRLMMQSLLADRFKLALHKETQQTPVYALVLAKPGKTGPKLRRHPATDTSCSVVPADAQSVSPASAQPSTAAGGFPVTCGGLDDVPASAPGRIAFGYRNVPMSLIALQMTGMCRLDRPVIDETGLIGKYDFAIEFSPQRTTSANPASDTLMDNTGPDVWQALLEQDGLKLKPQKADVDVIIIDHIEHPSEN